MKIKWGALVVDGRNKIGGQVASKNKAGAYMKNKVTPTNPSTSAQSNVRSNLTLVSRGWAGLTPAQRSAWNGYAEQYPYVDIFGDSKYLTGFAYFVKCNLLLLNAGSAQVTSPPATQEVTDISFVFDALENPATMDLAASVASMPANHKVIVLASAGLSMGRVPSKSDLRQILVASTITTSIISCGSDYGSKFGDLVADTKIGVGTYVLNTSTGLATQLRQINGIVGSV